VSEFLRRIALALLLAGAALQAQSKYPTFTVLTTKAPATTAAGQQVPLRATVVDAGGYALPASGTIQFLDGAGSLGPPVPVPTGVAAITLSLVAGNHNLRAQFSGDAGLAASTSNILAQTVVANVCPQLVFTQSPASASPGANIGPVTVQVLCGPANSTVNLTAQGLGGFTPGSVTSAQAVNGIATFNNLSLTTPGNYTLAASAAGATGAVSNTFTIGPPALGLVFTVSNTQDAGSGSFRDVLSQANVRGGFITFQPGVEGAVALATPLPPILSDVQILGPGPRIVTLSGGAQLRALSVLSGTVVVSGLTISDGAGSGSASDAAGSGVQNFSSSLLAVDNCLITNNSSPVVGTSGGGIYNKGRMAVTNSTISYNTSASAGAIDNAGILTIGSSLLLANVAATGAAGGILNEPGASLTVTNSTIVSNAAAQGGGALMNSGSVTIADSTLTRNEARGSDGGAILNQTGATISIVRSTVSANTTVQDGGAIANTTTGNVTIANSTFAANRAAGNGGMLANKATAIAALTSTTISGNASVFGGAILNEGSGSQLSLINSIAAGNTNSLSGAADDCQGCGAVSAGNLIGGDPKLGRLQNNGGPTQTMLPLPASPAIGAGAASSAVTTDQRGQARPVTGAADYGAVQTSYALAFSPQPQSAAVGAPVNAGVQLQEGGRPFVPANNLASGSQTPLALAATLTLASGTGNLTGNMANVDPASGLASFPSLQVDTVGPKTLRASVPGFAPVTSQPFTITPAQTIPAAILIFAGDRQTAVVNSDFLARLQVTVRDASGAPLPGITVTFTAVSGAAFSGGSPSTAATTDASGVGTAATLTAGPTPGPAIVTATVPGYSFQVTFTLTVAPSPAAPVITAAGFLNGASFLTTPAAPNTIMAAFGTFPCGTTASLRVNGQSAEVISASVGQVNFTMPATLAGAGTAAVQAVCGALISQPIQLQVAGGAPGVFTITRSGSGQAAALNQDGSLNTPLNPAAANQVVSLYVTGLGPYNAVGEGGLQRMSLPIQVLLGGTQATVQYAGNSPGYTPGLQQVNIVVPPGVTGLATPLILTAGGFSSQPGVTLAIQ